jgi:hypothetical protein
MSKTAHILNLTLNEVTPVLAHYGIVCLAGLEQQSLEKILTITEHESDVALSQRIAILKELVKDYLPLHPFSHAWIGDVPCLVYPMEVMLRELGLLPIYMVRFDMEPGDKRAIAFVDHGQRRAMWVP